MKLDEYETSWGKKGRKYPSYCCQKCGEQIGWLGRFLHYMKLTIHKCKKNIK